MIDELSLFLPGFEDLWFRRQMLSDPATMAYNAYWLPPDGCIDFPESGWASWYEQWVGRAPERFYAYLIRKSDGAFVGDVNYHYVPEKNCWDMGLLITASERGRGYGSEGLALLLDRAFRVDGIECLHNEFETARDAACHIHRAHGFREVSRDGECIHLLLTKEEYNAVLYRTSPDKAVSGN